MENAQLKSLATMGEFGLIDHLTKDIKLKHNASLKGVGDDAAVIKSGNECILISTDLLVEGTHFDPIYTPMKHLGYKAVIVNISDIFAMNAIPTQITVSMALSSKYTLEAIEDFYSGIYLACEVYGLDLVGGDTTSSPFGLQISISALGVAQEKDIVYRNGAKEKDLLVVSGDLGGAYLGLQILEREKSVYKAAPSVQPDLSGYDYILERQLKPEARKDIIQMLKEIKVKPTAMIDVSDGLASDAMHIAHQSKLGVSIYENKIPIDPLSLKTASEFNLDATTCVLNGGEDYELLFTISQGDFEKIKNNPDLTVIGYMSEAATGNNLITAMNQMIKLKAQGWDALKKED